MKLGAGKMQGKLKQRLLPSQINEILAIVDESHFERHQFELADETPFPLLRFNGRPELSHFAIPDQTNDSSILQIRRSPGRNQMTETLDVSGWHAVLSEFRAWLAFLEREIVADERKGGGSSVTPEWALIELPAEFETIAKEIALLQEKERRLRRMAGLLWETGEPLNRLVRDTFQQIGFKADLTQAGETFDVLVHLNTSDLLIEVTGIDGQINKGSKKIAQVLKARQRNATTPNRACVAVNAYRQRPIRERDSLAIVTPEALELLVGLNAIVFTTSDLFNAWKLSLTDVVRATSEIGRLAVAAAGVVRLAEN